MTPTFASKSALNEAIKLINTGQIVKVEDVCRLAIDRNHETNLEEFIEVLKPLLPRYQKYESINREC